MEEDVNLAFDTRVIIENIVVKVAELRDIPFLGLTLKRYGNISFHKNSSLKNDQALKKLDK